MTTVHDDFHDPKVPPAGEVESWFQVQALGSEGVWEDLYWGRWDELEDALGARDDYVAQDAAGPPHRVVRITQAVVT